MSEQPLLASLWDRGEDERLALGCCLQHGAFEMVYPADDAPFCETASRTRRSSFSSCATFSGSRNSAWHLPLTCGTMKRDCKPVAVVIGGIVSSTLLILIVLPTLYAWFEAVPTQLREHRVEGACP